MNRVVFLLLCGLSIISGCFSGYGATLFQGSNYGFRSHQGVSQRDASGAGYFIERITSIEGLPHNDVLCMIQDSHGFVWIATNGGLCRYDGRDFVNYGIGDRGLTSNLILSVCEDLRSNIWIGTANRGLFLYCRDENRFIHSSQMCDDDSVTKLETVRSLCNGEEDELWFYSRDSRCIVCLKVDIESKRITSTIKREIPSHLSPFISTIYYANENLYIGTSSGLVAYSVREDKFVDVEGIASTINDIERRGDKLYIASQEGCFSYDPVSEQSVKHKNLIISRRICWSGDDLYQVTRSGLYKSTYVEDKQQFTNPVTIDEYNLLGISELIDVSTGGVWVGFIKEAIRAYQPNKRPFDLISGIGNNHITPIFEDMDSNYWVGTNGDGYYILESLDGEQRNYNQRAYAQKTVVNSIVYSEYNARYYIAASNGVLWQKSIDDKPQLSIPYTTIRQILCDGHYLWLASYNDGFIRYDLRSGQEVIFTNQNSQFKSSITRNVISDSEGNIWIATSKGLYMIDAKDKDSELPEIIPILPEQTSSHYILPLCQSRSGDIWYGTLGAGLHRVSRDESGFHLESYNTDDLLSNNSISFIVEDSMGRMWMSHNNELSMVDMDNHRQISYDINNGLQNYGFNDISGCATSGGELFFGGVRGITRFKPESILIDSLQGKIRLTDLKIFGNSILQRGDITTITPTALEAATKIELSYNQNNFAFTFSSFNYSCSKKQRYRYRLLGVDREWRESVSNEAEYMNVVHGRYTFVVCTANGDGIWNPEELSVEIVISPPFWLTWYAYILYVLFIVAVLSFAALYYRSHLNRKNAIKLARLETTKVQELLDMRTRFVANVSHEFRTPLTLILSPLQRLLRDEELMADRRWRELLSSMSYNGEVLMRLVSEFLSFSKQASKSLTLNLKREEIGALIERLSSHFIYMAEDKGIEMLYTPPQDPLFMLCDAEHIEHIIYNLISNAVKHTARGGRVELSVVDRGQCVDIIVTDTGAGIPLDVRSHIFDRFVTRESEASRESLTGIGIGLSLTKDLVVLHGGEISFTSEVDKGTTFKVTLPKLSIDDDELLTNTSSAEEMECGEEIGVTKAIATKELLNTSMPESDMEQGSEGRQVVLIVDDNEQMLKLLYSIFEDDYKLIISRNGAEGLNMAQIYLPDLIISDVMMPVMDGLELLERIKGGERTSHIPVVLLSAKSSLEDISKGYSCQADAYATKPFDNGLLKEQVSSLISNRRATLNYYKQESKSLLNIDESQISSESDRLLIRRITLFVEANIGDSNLKVLDVCNEVGMTQVRLNKRLKQLIGVTASGLIKSIRLKRAAELLRTGRHTVASVTYDMGFNDLRHFRDSFCKEYGMFPQAYKIKYNSSPLENESEE
ncbi:MAG: ATP-binding protein [Rikenellaceae bacterium]